MLLKPEAFPVAPPSREKTAYGEGYCYGVRMCKLDMRHAIEIASHVMKDYEKTATISAYATGFVDCVAYKSGMRLEWLGKAKDEWEA